MNIIVKTPLMADKIKALLDGATLGGIDFAFVSKKGMEMTFTVTGGEADAAIDAAKAAIKATSFGKGISFSVVKG